MSTKVETGVKQKLLVTEVTESGGTFFVQLDTPEAYQVQDLAQEINTHTLGQSGAQVNFEPGSKCYARASDEVWYRALIVGPLKDKAVRVYFVDYGNSEEVDVSRVFPPSGKFFELPYQALCCTISDFIPNHAKSNEAVSSLLSESLLNQEVFGVFRSLSSSHEHPYQQAVLQDKLLCYNVTLFQDEAGEMPYSELLVDRGLGQFAICSENVAIQSQEKVFVSFSDSPGRFWLQLASKVATLEAIETALADRSVTSHYKPLPREAVFPGVACCAVFPDDSSLYRVQVVQIVKGGKVELQFVDYGNSLTVSISELLSLPPGLCSTPAQAIQCCLEGVRPVKKDWTSESCDTFSRGTTDIELDAQFVDELMPEVFNVVLRNPVIGSNISEMLISSKCAQSSDPPPLLNEAPPQRLVPATPPAEALPQSYSSLTLEVSKQYQITITFAESPSVVWGQLVKYQSEFGEMMSKMSKLFAKPSTIPGLKVPAPGQPCAAQFSYDKEWYRGRVEAVDNAEKQANVLFVDFGNNEMFRYSNLKQLSPELMALPTQAVSFSMQGLTPADGSSTWAVKTVQKFQEMATSSSEVCCKVVELDGDGYPAARLIDAKGRDIGEALAEMNLAHSAEVRKSRVPVKSYRQDRAARDDRSTRSSGGSRDSSTRASGGGSRDGSVRGSGSSGARDSSTRASGERDSSARASGARDSSTRASRERDSSARASGERDSITRGSSQDRPQKRSPHQSASQSPFQSKAQSPFRTGTRQPQPPRFHTQALKVGKQYSLTIVHVVSLLDFYVQLTDGASELTSVMEKIAALCGSDAARLPGDLTPGKPVLAQFTDDQEWYRAVVTKRSQGVSVVTFVDYGNSDTLQDSSLIEIPPDFLTLPAQAVHCSLDGVGVQVSAEAAKTTFTELTLEQTATGVVKKVAMEEEADAPVYTIELCLADGSKAIDALIEGGHVSIPRATLSHLSPTSSPTLTEIKFPDFPTDAHVDVCVSYVASPAKFFLQLLESAARLRELTAGMNEIYSKMKDSEGILLSLNTGIFCAARFSEDGVWYRTRIVSLEEATAHVMFVDYGNEETVQASDLKSLRIQFAAESCLAVQCTLDGLSSEAMQSRAVIDRFSKIVSGEMKLVATFLKPFTSHSDPVPVQLFDTSQAGTDQDVAAALQNMHSNPGLSQLGTRSAKVTTGDTVSKPGAAHSDMTIPFLQPELNQPLTCTVTHVESPSEFYCQLPSLTSTAENLLNSLYTFYAEDNAGEALEDLKIGTTCAARFTDGSWYRAKINSLTPEGGTVSYVDYGNREVVSVADLRALDQQFCLEPILALRCSLNGIRPTGSSTEWKEECRTKLSEAILEQECELTILKKMENETFDVKLFLTGSDISEVLVRDSFAAKHPPTPEPTKKSPKTAKKTPKAFSIPPFPAEVGGEYRSDISEVLVRDGFAAKHPPTPEPTKKSPKTAKKTSKTKTPKAFSIPPFPAEVGGEYSVYVTCSVSPLDIYCQPAEPDPSFIELTEKIQKFCASEEALGVDTQSLKSDDIILAQFSEDQDWYRARVASVSSEGDSANVLFLDYGNSETTTVFKQIPERFCTLPAQSVHCSILGAEEYAVVSESETDFNVLLTTDENGFTMRFIDAGLEMSTVQLACFLDGKGVLQYACEQGVLAKKKEEAVEPNEGLKSSSQVESVASKVDKEGASGGVESGHELVESGQKLVESGLVPVQLATGSKEEGFVSHLESPTSFWLQLASCEEELESLTERLAAVYGNSNELQKLVFPDPRPGQACCTQFSEDRQWYRSVVEAVSSEGVKVHFVDYGNGETVTGDRIRLLKQEFLEIPVQAVHCLLAQTTPPSGSDWSDESITCFSSLVLDKALTIEFMNNSSSSSLGVWSVSLLSQSEDIAVAMVKEGAAASKGDCPPGEEKDSNLPGTPQILSSSIPKLVFREGETRDVYLSHLTNSPLEFYCQLVDNDTSINELMAAMADFYTDNSPQAILKEGEFCAAQYSGNNAWYRAKILHLGSGGEREGEGVGEGKGEGEGEGGEGKGEGEGITIHFVDYGNCETVQPSSVRGLQPSFATLASQAICCSLSTDLSLVLPAENMLRFHSLDLNQCYRLTVTGCLDDRYIIQLSDLEGADLSEGLLAVDDAVSLLMYTSLPCEPLSVLDVYVSHINSPTSFYCQPLQFSDTLEAMMTELAATIISNSPPAVTSPTVGTPCLAQYCEDQEWYRARIVSGSATDKVVQFVDYGNSESTSSSSLRQLPPDLLRVPIQALHCSVFDPTTASCAGDWVGEKVEEFRSMLGDGPLSLTITGIFEGDLCVCEVSGNGAPIDFSSLLPAEVPQVETEKSKEDAIVKLTASNGGGISLQEDVFDERPYASSASSSSLPIAGLTLTASEGVGRLLEHSAGNSQDGNLSIVSTATGNVSTLALKGSSQNSANLSETESSEEVSDQGEGEPLIKAPFTLILSIPEQFESKVIFVESPSLLYVQRVDCQPELENLSTEIEQYCQSFAEKQFQEIFHKGDFVLAQYSVDDAWYRAKVIGTGTEDAIVQVFFIDFGNLECIAPDKVIMCPESFLELPCQAIACSLSTVPRREYWPSEYKKLIDQHVRERVVKVKVVHPASEGMRPTVNLEVVETGLDISQKVLDFLQEECDRGNLSNYVIPEEPEDEEIPVNGEGGGTSISLGETPKADAKSVTSSEQTTKCFVPERAIEMDTTHDVYVISCETPHAFVCQLVSEADSLEAMSEALESAYEGTDTSHLALPTPPVVGDFVCGQFTEDSKWYRARVLSLEPEDKAELLYIDFGNSEFVEISSIRTLDLALPSHSPYALECYLAGVEPPEHTEGFDAQATDHFLEISTCENVCKAEILFVDSAGHYGVNLFSSEGVNVAQSLVDSHLATALKDTPATVTCSSLSDDITPEVATSQSDPTNEGATLSVTGQPEQLHSEENPLPTVEGSEVTAKEDLKPVSGAEANPLDQFATDYPARQSLQIGSTCQAHITSITNLDDFQCQLVDSQEALDEMMGNISSRNYQIGDDQLAVTDTKKGLPVCVCFTKDDSWYRAEISSVMSRERVRVFYVDYGNSEDVDISRVKRLEREFCEGFAPVIVKCSLPPLTDHDLDSLRPLEDAWELVWPKKCLQHFRELVGGCEEVELVCEGVGGGGVCLVKVVVTEGGDGGEGTGKPVADSATPQNLSDQLETGSGEAVTKRDVRAALISRLVEPQDSTEEQIENLGSEDGDDGWAMADEGEGGGESEGEEEGEEEYEEDGEEEEVQGKVAMEESTDEMASQDDEEFSTPPDEPSEEDAGAKVRATVDKTGLDEAAKRVTRKAISDAESENAAEDLSRRIIKQTEKEIEKDTTVAVIKEISESESRED